MIGPSPPPAAVTPDGGVPLLETIGVTKRFPLTRSFTDFVRGVPASAIQAVDQVSIHVNAGETLGLIGESGSGKTTLGWLIARIHSTSAGKILFEGREVQSLEGRALRRWRRNVQVVFQDPVASLDPRLRVWQIVGEPLRAQGPMSKSQVRKRVSEVLPTVGLPGDCLDQYPHEFSGGGRQRLGLARALSVDPRLVILDEPTSALDVAVQAQILNRLVTLQRERGLAYLLITHNVSAVRYVADRIAVLYLGKIAEVGPVRAVLEHPQHPYTKALIAALPVADTRRRRTRYRLTGEIPTLIQPPPGCRFASRCPYVIERCRVEVPELRPVPGGGADHLSACHRTEEVGAIRPETLIEDAPELARPVRPAPATPP